MSAPSHFLDSLQAGDLIAGTVSSSSKLHLVTVRGRVKPGMTRGDVSARALSGLFDCQPLCEVRPRYYWTPVYQQSHWKAEDRCRWCFSKWRAAGRPEIKGFDTEEKTVESTVRLPWGWHEVTPTGHPLDLPADAADPDPDEDEKKVGSRRTEVKRWIRGNRYVRITQSLDDKRFCVRFGDLNDKVDEEHWWIKSGWDLTLIRAVVLMACGGNLLDSSSTEVLTMKDILETHK